MWATLPRRVVRNRLAQFLAIGLVLFALAPPSRATGRDVVLSGAYLSALRAERTRRLGGRALSEQDLQHVEQRAIEDELFVREAQRLGLDDGDSIVRQRLVQKMLFLAEETAGTSRLPSEEEIARYYDETRERWTRPARLRFVHVVTRTAEEAAALRPRVVAWSATTGAPPDEAPPFGDALPVSRSVRARLADLAPAYGEAFADAVSKLEPGAWSAPIGSRQGAHLVRVLANEPASCAPLSEVHDEVRAALVASRRRDAVDGWLRSALARYRVEVDGHVVDALAPSDRVASRGGPSGED